MNTLSSTVPTTTPTSADRRRWTRYNIDVALRATIRSGDLLKTVRGRGNNLSQGGLAAHLAIELSIGDFIELEITLPYSSQTLSIAAVVRNRESYCYGVEFIDPQPGAQREIMRCCHALQLTQQ